MLKPIVDGEAAELIAPLFVRGRAELEALYDRLYPPEPDGRPNRNRPFGHQSMCIVTEKDFFANIDICYRHVTHNSQNIQILSIQGGLRALLQELPPRSP